ncbi:class I SAM-dependent DNA methyltransferase [Gemmatimonas sp.]|uniref:class I SAM-dependent DNA methyltransferase n=1 Tax=Gemmatimonas sp. TaxID=1962908 RepID=UPI003DA27985
MNALASRWADARAGERANLQLYMMELCDALMVTRPRPRGTGYEFELQIDAITVDGKESANYIDCWKAGHFALEGKDYAASNRGSTPNEASLRRAYGQVRNYVHHVPGEGPPPYLMVLDVAKTLIVWDRWAGTYGGFEAGHRIDLATLGDRPADVALLRDIWENPSARDRRGAAAAVTTEIAGKLAELAAALEGRGHEQEEVARFLMRVVFSCFAEDIGLLPADAFRQTVTEAGLNGSPTEFSEAVEGLWRHMDTGGRVGPFKFLKFNGHFFKDATALPLTRTELVLLEAAARADWSQVEPSIFGTLLTRALNPDERHRLGAEYTPRAYIERLIRPTIEDPILERWTAVQAEVVQLLETGKAKDQTQAESRLRDFHAWMRGLAVLDPACGSGNFLYVAMHAMKRIELEVLRAIERVTGHPDLRLEEIGPSQFHGIEVKRWAREIAELTLWIGYHQWWRQHHDVLPHEPILQDTGTLECRDALLAWDRRERQAERERPDPTPRLRHQVTGEDVPDPAARVEYQAYIGAREAPWPRADFIVGNPPYLGNKRLREALGDDYVDAVREAYPHITASADLVMYWWHRAAREVAEGRTIRAGLITTSSITQVEHRGIVHAMAERGAKLVWAIANHPWNADGDAAAVRVAMSVVARDSATARLLRVDDTGRVVSEIRAPRLNADFSVHADVATASTVPLQANAGLTFRGVSIVGDGFRLDDATAAAFRADPGDAPLIRRLINGRDLTDRPRNEWVIDFGMMSELEARNHARPYQLVRDTVRPMRMAQKRKTYRDLWWRFAEPRPELREAVQALPWYIATPMVVRHRVFFRVSAADLPDQRLMVIAAASDYLLGVLSSRIHVLWAESAGGRHGVGNDPVYNNSTCFLSFPFPNTTEVQQTAIASLAAKLHAHRDAAVARSGAVTVTAMYGVMAKLRAGLSLSPAERIVHTDAACEVLQGIHNELDAAVAAAYGWEWPEVDAVVLERLVTLHDARVLEEQAGVIRWVQAAFQKPRFGAGALPAPELSLDMADAETMPTAAAMTPSTEWPKDAIAQITMIRGTVLTSPATVDDTVARFKGGRRDIVLRHLETLTLLGELEIDEKGRYRPAAGAMVSG